MKNFITAISFLILYSKILAANQDASVAPSQTNSPLRLLTLSRGQRSAQHKHIHEENINTLCQHVTCDSPIVKKLCPVNCKVDEIVITTGYDGNYYNDIELIKMEHVSNGNIIATPTSCKLPDYPMKLALAKGTYSPQSNTNMICGGQGDDMAYNTTNKCHQFDTDSMSWNEVNPLKIGRQNHAITSIGKSLVTCGGHTVSAWSRHTQLSSCEILANGNGQWTTMKPLPTALHGHCMVEMDPSTIVSLGGKEPTYGISNKMYEYNMMSNQWTETNTPMTQKRYGHECVKLSEDQILVIGGREPNKSLWRDGSLKSTEVYDRIQRKWKKGPMMPKPMAFGQFVKASPGSKFLGYYVGRVGSGREVDTRVDNDDWKYMFIYGLSKDLSNFQLLRKWKKTRSGHVAFRLHKNISDKCGD